MEETLFETLRNNKTLSERYNINDKLIQKRFHEKLGNLQIPSNWKLTERGLFERKIKEEQEITTLVTHDPVFVIGAYENISDYSEGFIVTWFNGREWKEIAESKDVFADNRKIISLAKNGFPVNSNNSKKVIQFIQDFYAENKLLLDFKTYSEQLGWNKNGFLLGNKYMTEQQETLVFFPSDNGEKQFVEGFHAKGKLDSWLQIIEQVREYPRAMTVLYASFGSVLCELMGVDPFIVDISGDTSKGKTILVKICASVWGKPTDKRNGIIKTWRTTPVAIERNASVLNSLPLFLDDTNKSDNKDIIPKMVYMLSGGQGKSRGSIHGSQTTKHWHNITITTGEQKITSFSKSDGGVSGRVLPVTNFPFGQPTEDKANLLNDVVIDLQDNYGLSGPKWIEYILENTKDQEIVYQWKSIYKSYRSYYTQEAKGNSVVIRIADNMALLALTAALINDCFGTNYDYAKTLDTVWKEILEDNAEVDRPKQALESVISWFEVNKNRFITERRNENGKEKDILPFQDIWGKRLKGDDLFIFPTVLDNFLRKEGYEPTAIIKSWKTRGWLEHDKGRNKGRMYLNTEQKWGYVVKKETINQLEN